VISNSNLSPDDETVGGLQKTHKFIDCRKEWVIKPCCNKVVGNKAFVRYLIPARKEKFL
jgi:hypothetical protein